MECSDKISCVVNSNADSEDNLRVGNFYALLGLTFTKFSRRVTALEYVWLHKNMQHVCYLGLLVERQLLTTRPVMKPFIKYWRLTLQKTQTQKPRRIATANECIERKIHASKIQLMAVFEKELTLFLAEFQKPGCFASADCGAYMTDVLNRHLDILFVSCIKEYVQLCILNYHSAIRLDQKQASEANRSSDVMLSIEGIRKEITEDIQEIIAFLRG